jgi:hypothetical protein
MSARAWLDEFGDGSTVLIAEAGKDSDAAVAVPRTAAAA